MPPPTRFDKRRALLEEPASSYNCHCEEGVARRGNPHPQRCKAPPVPVGDGKRTDCHGPDGPRNDSNLHTLHTKLAAGRYRPPCHCEEGRSPTHPRVASLALRAIHLLAIRIFPAPLGRAAQCAAGVTDCHSRLRSFAMTAGIGVFRTISAADGYRPPCHCEGRQARGNPSPLPYHIMCKG